MASLIDRALAHRRGAALPEGGNAFPDDDASVHAAAVDRLAAAGIVTGYADGTFRPSEDITREQMASFLARSLRLLVSEGLSPPTPKSAARPSRPPLSGATVAQRVDWCLWRHAALAGGLGRASGRENGCT